MDLPSSKISELMKLGSLEVIPPLLTPKSETKEECTLFTCHILTSDVFLILMLYGVTYMQSASTHSLFGVVSRALDDSIETKNEDIPQVGYSGRL